MTEGAGAPLIAVVMPVFNHARYVEEAVRSIVAQTFRDWSLTVVDDGSTDGSDRIVEAIAAGEPRITLVRQANAGPAKARNVGVRRSTSPWLAYLDSDDLWFPTTLERYARAIHERPEKTFFYASRHRLDEDGVVTETPGEFQEAESGTRELFGRMYLSHMSVCYRRRLFEAVGGYDEKLRSCEDYELYLRMSLETRFTPLGFATGLRRRHGTNISRQTGFTRRLEAEVLKRFVDKQGGAARLEPARIAARLGRLYYASGRQYLKEGRFTDACRRFAEAHRYARSLKSTALLALARLLSPFGGRETRSLPPL